MLRIKATKNTKLTKPARERPEQEFLDKLMRDDLERALARLPEHYRIVVILADLEEFTYGEIGNRLRAGAARHSQNSCTAISWL